MLETGYPQKKEFPPLYISIDGKPTKQNPIPQASTKEKRLPRELWYPSTPAPFEGFLTMIRDTRTLATASVL